MWWFSHNITTSFCYVFSSCSLMVWQPSPDELLFETWYDDTWGDEKYVSEFFETWPIWTPTFDYFFWKIYFFTKFDLWDQEVLIPQKSFLYKRLTLTFFLESVFLIFLLSQCVEIQVPRSTWYSENHLGRTKGLRVEPHRDSLTETVNFHEYAYKSYYIYS